MSEVFYLSPALTDVLLDRPCMDARIATQAMTALQTAGYLDHDFQITKTGEAMRQQLLNAPENRSVLLHRVTGPWTRPGDIHPSFDIHGPDAIVASVFVVDGDFEGAERRANIMAAALDADARNER
jgi:hypothetical protein